MPLPLLAAAPAAIATTKNVLGLGGAISMYAYSWFHEEPLPDMMDAVDDACQDVHADVGALVIDVAERSKKEEGQNDQQNARLGEVVARFGSEVTSKEEAASIASQAYNIGETQTKINSVMDDKLKNLPDVIRVNQENRALRLRNEKLESQVESLKAKVVDGLSCIEELTEFAKEQHVEINELQKQLRAKNFVGNQENADATISFFARNS